MKSLTHLIPVKDTAPHHLMECVNSIVSQSDAPILIIDDGSRKADTITTLSLIDKLYDQVEVHTLPENMGTPTALNVGHSMISTDYTALIGSSDIALPGKYKHQMDMLAKNPKIDVLGTWLYAFKDADPFRKKFFSFELREQPKPGSMPAPHHKHFMVCHGTVIYKNSAVNDAGGYNPAYRRGQDVELWSRMHANGAVFRNIEKCYYLFRR